MFIGVAFRRLIYSENELEAVLTFYTHKNKSASVFLGTKVCGGGGVRRDIPERSSSREQVKSKRPQSELHCVWIGSSVELNGICVLYFLITFKFTQLTFFIGWIFKRLRSRRSH